MGRKMSGQSRAGVVNWTARHGGNLVRFHAQHDQVGLAEIGDAVARGYAGDDVLVLLPKDQAVLANGLQLRPARDDADLFTGLGELGGQQAADGARAAGLNRRLGGAQ